MKTSMDKSYEEIQFVCNWFDQSLCQSKRKSIIVQYGCLSCLRSRSNNLGPSFLFATSFVEQFAVLRWIRLTQTGIFAMMYHVCDGAVVRKWPVAIFSDVAFQRWFWQDAYLWLMHGKFFGEIKHMEGAGIKFKWHSRREWFPLESTCSAILIERLQALQSKKSAYANVQFFSTEHQYRCRGAQVFHHNDFCSSQNNSLYLCHLPWTRLFRNIAITLPVQGWLNHP